MLQDCSVGRLAVIGAVRGELANLSIDPVEQWPHLGGIVRVLISQLMGDDLAAVGIQRQVQLPPVAP
ncbi:hypothetical protein BC363_32645 [Ensifer sp. LC384]|nr:hypothetical protein BC363_32645 [Ensifer sp. LC384]